jgi:hypothetical protein
MRKVNTGQRTWLFTATCATHSLYERILTQLRGWRYAFGSAGGLKFVG